MSIPLLQLVAYLDSLFPIRLAEKWDHVGLLVGDSERIVRRVMCCLTVTPRIVEEAVRERVDMVVSHHPFPFHAMQRIVEGPDKEPVGGSIDGGMMLNLNVPALPFDEIKEEHHKNLLIFCYLDKNTKTH